MRHCLLILLHVCLCSSIVCAEDVANNNAAAPEKLQFKAGYVYKYVYQTEQLVNQKIVDDEIKTQSTITWQFALFCSKNTAKEAHLKLSIIGIMASINAPGFKHDIDTSRKESQLNVPLIGHLSLLNGKGLDLFYDYQQQRLRSLSGADSIHKAFLKLYPRDEFEEKDDPRYLRAKQQYSDKNLLRLWREILRPAGSGDEIFKLEEPIGIEAKRSWKPGEKNDHTFTLTRASSKEAPMITLQVGPNAVKAQLQSLSGSGAVLMKEQCISQAKGQVKAQLQFKALTQDISQSVESNWRLQLTEIYERKETEPEN